MIDNSQSQFLSNKKIYTIKVKSMRGYNSFQHMNPYQYLREINRVIQQRGIDIKVLQVKYFLSKSKAQKGFESYDSNRFDFQVDKTFNDINGAGNQLLDWIFAQAVVLKKSQNVTAQTDKFQNFIEEEKRKQEEKKITDIDKFLQRLMRISQEGKRMKQRFDDMISFEKFRNFDHSCFKEGDYNVFIKALMSQPVKMKLQEEKQSKKGFVVQWKKTEIKSFFHPNAQAQTADRVQELAQITSFTLGCSAPQPTFIDSLRQKGDQFDKDEQKNGKFFYFDTERIQSVIQQKHNASIELRSMIAINRQSSASDVIKSFEIQTQYFDQSIIKTQVNMGQIKKIEIYNGRSKDGIVEYYFYLAYPPKYFIAQLRKQVATCQEYTTNWERIENIFFLRNKKIAKNEFLRLYLFNNTILKIKLDKKNYSDRSFEKPFEMLEIIKQRFDDKISIPIYPVSERILFEWGLKSLESGFNYEKKFLNSLSNVKEQNKVWILKYFILIMVRYDHLYPSQINKIVDQIEKNLEDFDVYIYVFWKIATDIWGYNDRQKRFIEFLFEQVKSAKALNRTHMMKKIIRNTDMIAHVFRMNSAPSGFLYAAPTPQMKGRLLKQYDKESQYFMRVSVCDDHQGTLKNQKYITKGALKSKMLQFTILNRKYIPLGWSPSQLRSYSLWYLHQTLQTASGKRMNRQIVLSFLGSFSEIDNPAKRAARIGQSFSASWTFQGSKIKAREQPDIYSENNFMFTDGIGKISKDLIESISLKLGLTQLSIIQIRYLGTKGLFVLDQSLRRNQVVLRPSMIKYRCTNTQAQRYLDILDYNKYKAGFLNRQIIILLKTLRIPDTVFEELQKNHIQNLSQMSFKDCSVFKQMNEDLNTEINNLEPANKTILSLVRAGFDLQTEPFFRGVLQTMKKNGYNQLKNKCNIRVQKSARIIGIIDQFCVLEQDQVYCAIYDPFSLKKQSEKLEIIQENAIITRNPCLDPADIRVVKCVSKTEIKARFQQKGLTNKFQKFLNCVIFPQKGKVPLTAQISGSDLDGDNFFICWDQTLVPKITDVRKIKTIDNPNTQKKTKSVNAKKEQQMYKQMMNFFFEYINYEKLGQIDNSHLVKADRDTTNFAENTECLKLSEIHGKAVDFPKTGYCPEVDPKLLVNEYPDFMQKQGSQSYISQSILGKLYRQIKQKIQHLLKDKVYKNDQTLDIDLIRNIEINYSKDQVYEVMDNLLEYEKSLANLVKLVGIDTEYEVYSGNFSIAKQKVDQYGKTRLISTILQLKERYFDIFFEGLPEEDDNYLEAKQQSLEHDKTFTLQTKRRAILYYICSYIYKFGDKLRFPIHGENLEKIRSWIKYCLQSRHRLDKQGKFCGFIWFVIPKVIINIKKRALIEIKTQKNIIKESKNQKEQDSNKEEMKEKERDDSEQEQAI